MLFKYGYNAKEHIKQLPEEFRKEDAFRDKFARIFKDSVLAKLKEGNKHLLLPIDIHDLTENYAHLVISSVRSTIEKNDNSPLFRIKDEISALYAINKKYKHLISNRRSRNVFNKALELAKTHFPQITELSEDALTLLKVNVEWHHITYMSAFYSPIED